MTTDHQRGRNLFDVMAEDRHHVFLVPGFFGFATLGDLPYFAHVEDLLKDVYQTARVEVDVVAVDTDPTASIRKRAASLLATVAAHASQDEGPIHLIGHSTGGLDARLLVTPGVDLPALGLDVEHYTSRVRTVTCICTPHFGTPIASFFAGRLEQSLLQMIYLATAKAIRHGGLPLGVLNKLTAMLSRLVTGSRPSAGALEHVRNRVLADFSADRRSMLESFLNEMQSDQGVIPQLTPDAMDLFNATVQERPNVRYGSVVARGPSPGISTTVAAGMSSYGQATHALYCALHQLASRTPAPLKANDPTEPYQARLLAAYDEVPPWAASDGIVPTRSQFFGELLYAARADHLDVVGYFEDDDPSYHDWLVSGSQFHKNDFAALWTAVANHLLQPIEQKPLALLAGILPPTEPVVPRPTHVRYLAGLLFVGLIGLLSGLLLGSDQPLHWQALIILPFLFIPFWLYRVLVTIPSPDGEGRARCIDVRGRYACLASSRTVDVERPT